MTFPVAPQLPPLPPLGGDRVGFVTLTATGTPDTLGEVATTPNTVWIDGCLHRPLSASETPVALTDIATQVWQTTAPPEAAALAAESTGQLVCNGHTYEIIGGPQPFTGDDGQPYFVKLLSKEEKG